MSTTSSLRQHISLGQTFSLRSTYKQVSDSPLPPRTHRYPLVSPAPCNSSRSHSHHTITSSSLLPPSTRYHSAICVSRHAPPALVPCSPLCQYRSPYNSTVSNPEAGVIQRSWRKPKTHQTGSYATTIFDQSFVLSATAFNCFVTTSIV